MRRCNWEWPTNVIRHVLRFRSACPCVVTKATIRRGWLRLERQIWFDYAWTIRVEKIRFQPQMFSFLRSGWSWSILRGFNLIRNCVRILRPALFSHPPRSQLFICKAPIAALPSHSGLLRHLCQQMRMREGKKNTLTGTFVTKATGEDARRGNVWLYFCVTKAGWSWCNIAMEP